MKRETENIEFKQQYTNDLYKEIVAFANTDGGVIYVGADNAGNPIGLDDIDTVYTSITNGVRDNIVPDVTVFIKYSLRPDNVISITVSEGTAKPYYIKSKGLKPSGVYVRQGTSSVPASSEQIRTMIKESDGDSFESRRSLEQELTFNKAHAAFEHYGVDFTEEKYKVLGITDKTNSMYTNLALLISDQCEYSIKAAVFSDSDNTVFRDAKEFKGSVFEQLDGAFSYLKLCNKTAAEFNGLERIEKADYPEDALREALLNSIVHRDYSLSGSIIINVNDYRTEFISIGGIVPGLELDDIKSGISQPRNKKLADIFYRLRLIEAYGTGIRRIYKQYEGCLVKPEIKVTANTFKIILPNMNMAAQKDSEAIHTSADSQVSAPTSHQQSKIIDYIREKGRITDSDIQKLLLIGRTRAYMISKEMCDKGLITSVGRGINKFYALS